MENSRRICYCIAVHLLSDQAAHMINILLTLKETISNNKVKVFPLEELVTSPITEEPPLPQAGEQNASLTWKFSSHVK